MPDSSKMNRIRELTGQLNKAAESYYAKGVEIMPNRTYDELYDELVSLERETGFSLSTSPTLRVGWEAVSELPKERHESPMLSLDKTKSAQDLAVWLGDRRGVLSWKMDGLTVVLTYRGGVLVKAVTRGNGEIGEVITGNAKAFEALPLTIPYKGDLTVRGEAVISYEDFDRINELLPDELARYKNPRNLCSGSVRQLDPKITAGRHVHLIAFSLVSSGEEFVYLHEQLDRLKELGFETVEYRLTDTERVEGEVLSFKERIVGNKYPSDGLVLFYDDLAYGHSLGRTAKFPRDAIAFKWQDETAETVLRRIEWSASRTGLINPVAVFDPVELEGTTVSRASVHNISVIRELKLGVGDRITVYKANMIIPQIAENLTGSGVMQIPEVCPVCGGPTEIRMDKETECLYCKSPECPAKKLKAFSLLVSRDALNIDGISEMSLEKLIDAGYIREFADLFRLSAHKEEIIRMEGFGERSFENLEASVKKASVTQLYRMIYGLGIPGIGLSGAKLICRHFGNRYEAVAGAGEEELKGIPGIGKVLAAGFTAYFADPEKRSAADRLREMLTFTDQVSAADARVTEVTGGTDGTEGGAEDTVPVTIGGKLYSMARGIFEGKTFVITGDVHIFRNRSELSALIEAGGGKAAGSVSAKTTCLINNDIFSSSTKNKKARELGIPILSEEAFLEQTGLNVPSD